VSPRGTELDPAELRQTAARFALSAPVDSVRPFGSGLINDTFLVAAGESNYILQRINSKVFPHPERIMDNLSLLTAHVTRQPPSDIRSPTLVPTKGGVHFVREREGGLWRAMSFIPETIVLSRVDTAAQAREVGRALGSFHRLVCDLDGGALAVPLPDFHVTPRYLDRLTQALETAGAIGQVPEVRRLAAFAVERREGAEVLEAARREARIPLRVTHGDPKLDNFLFDRESGRVVGLIDLDTVQQGLIQHDIADCLRSCCNRGGESILVGVPKIQFDLAICHHILDAFARETEGLLGPADIDVLYDAIRLIPLELGVRFLTDHLEGDRYFRVSAPGQNLRKAQVQLALVVDIERKERDIRAVIRSSFGLS
jgi:Ser/Thr protein kinase RdoA (MazF antagonist)